MPPFEDFDPEYLATNSILNGMLNHLEYNIFGCTSAMKSEGLQTILDYPDDFKFDLIIFDNTNTNCLLPLIQRFNYPPSVSVTGFLLPHHTSLVFGNGVQPSYLPSYVVRLPSKMNFYERVYNYLWLYIDLLVRYLYMEPVVENMVRERFGNEIPSLSRLADHLSLLLCNLDPTYHYPQPFAPNVIPVGGLHVRPAKQLPEDLRQIADKADDGIILFALGTNIRSDKLGSTKIKACLNAFKRINQTVFWKFESNLTAYSVPSNVHIRQWLPQNDILGHPKMKLFISHGGGLSTIEAATFGVPVIGIPFIVDQFMNVRMIEEKNYGIRLDYDDITEENLLLKINEIMQNKSYSEVMKIVSKRMRDQPHTPIERALFWIEYVMRHNGTHFLNTKARQMSYFVSTSTDVQLFLLSVIVLILVVIRKLYKLIISKEKYAIKEKIN